VSGFVCPIIEEMLPKLSLDDDSTSLAQIEDTKIQRNPAVCSVERLALAPQTALRSACEAVNPMGFMYWNYGQIRTPH